MTFARWLFFAPFLCLVGCFGTSTNTVVDSATWVEKDIAVDGVTISLGHREDEPAARVTRGGNAAADVMVFCGLAESEDGDLLSDEVATIYNREAEIYVADGLNLSDGGPGNVVRYRVVLPNGQEPWHGHMAVP